MKFALLLYILLLIYIALPKTRIGYPARAFDKDLTCKIKGILSILIVVHHYAIKDVCGMPSKGELFSWGALVVSFFFFLSGYGLEKSIKQKGEHYLNSFVPKSIVKLFVPVITASMMFLLWNYSFHLPIPSVKSSFSLLLSGQLSLPHSWFVLDLFICYLIFWFANRISAKNSKSNIILLLIILNVIVAYLLKFPENWYGTTISFYFGILSCKNEPLLFSYISNNKKTIYIIACFVAILLLSMPVLISGCFESPRNVYGLLIVYLTPFVCYISSCILPKIRGINIDKVLVPLGVISYEIYLIHGILLPLNNICNYWFVNLFVILSLTIIFAIIFHKINIWAINLLINNKKIKIYK